MMIQQIKQVGRAFTQTAPFVLSNTLILIPYVLFIGLSDGYTWQSILPFVLFYTLRMTGLFLIRGLRMGLDSFTLLMISLLLGGVGSLFGVLGFLYFPFYSFSGAFLGLSAAWLTPSKLTVDYHERANGFKTMKSRSYLYSIVLLGIIYALARFPTPFHISFTLAFYTLLFAMAYHTIRHYPNYELDFKEVPAHLLVPRELFLFIGFFLLLLILRSGRLLFDTREIDLAIGGFILLFLLLLLFAGHSVKKWKLPAWLNLFTFFNGMIGNFLFLFGTLYTGVVFGFSAIPKVLYFPYAVGLIVAMLGFPLVKKKLTKETMMPTLLGGFSFGLLLLNVQWAFPLAVGVLSFTRSCTSTWLNQRFYEEEKIPQDQRILLKSSLQNKGSLTFQFLIMTVFVLLTRWLELPLSLLLRITGNQQANDLGRYLLTDAKWISVGSLLLSSLIILLLWQRSEEK